MADSTEEQAVALRRVDIDDGQLVEAVQRHQVDFAVRAARHRGLECAHAVLECVLTFQQRGRQLIFREFRAGPKHGDASSSSRPAGGLLRHKAREGRANFCLPSRS